MSRKGSMLLLTVFVLGGCRSIGPSTISRDRINYMTAVSDSLKTQMLLNLVKIRYGDMPVFMDVSSLINQYTIDLFAGHSSTWEHDPFKYIGKMDLNGRYIDRPTITYSPMTGEKFTRSLMTAIPPGTVLNFLQSGKSPEFLLYLTVQSVNGIQNQGLTTPADPRFIRLVQIISEMQNLGGVVIKFGQDKNASVTSLVITNPEDPRAKMGHDEFKKILKLNPDATEYTVVYGGSPSSDTEIAMVTRSVFDIMTQVALSAAIPQSDIEEGRAYPTLPVLQEPMYKTIARIHSGCSPSQDANVIVRYRDLWFWIDDRDIESKRVLTTLLLMVNLAESGRQGATPLITVPIG